MSAPTFVATDMRHRGLLKAKAWSLCVGAGICIDILPTWPELCRQILNSSLKVALSTGEFKELTNATGWGFDAWLQAALNGLRRHGGEDDAFIGFLEEVIYGPLFDRGEKENLTEPLVEAFTSPHLLKQQEFRDVLDFFQQSYPRSSVLSIARTLKDAVDKGQGPSAILTFNYDTILETLLRMYEITDQSEAAGRHEFPRANFCRVTGPDRALGAYCPIYYLHGCMTPKPARRKRRIPHDSRDNLIATEASYIQMAESTASWSQISFLHHAQVNKLVIVGHSMADPNIRTWLAWSAERGNQQATRRAGTSIQALPHVWLTKVPNDSEVSRLMEYSLVHLGVRIGWLEEWREIEAALRNLLALDTVPKSVA